VALLERERELAAIDAVIENLDHGDGGALLVDGHAGIGKSTVIAAAVARAHSAGLRVLSACGGELERSFAFGVVRQLFDPLIRAQRASERTRLLSGAARLAAPVFGLPIVDASPPPTDPQEAALLGLFWLTSDLASRHPMLITLDDLQWADKATLAWLVFTLRRLAGLPVAVIGAARTAEGIDLERLAPEGGHVEVVTLEPLSDVGVRAVLTEHLVSRPDDAFVHAVIEATAGNPMLVREVARAIVDAGIEPTGERGSDAVRVPSRQLTGLVEARLSRLPADATALARAAAVMGAGVELRQAATLAGLDIKRAGEAADQLRAADVLASGSGLSFSHPLVRDTVEGSIPSAGRSAAHARAARLLDDEQEAPEAVAAHLLLSEPAGDSWAEGRLRAAGQAALMRGAPDSAIAVLRRALREGCPGARAGLLAELGGAETLVRDEQAAKHLEMGIELITEPRQRLETVLARATYMLTTGELLDAYATLENCIPEAMDVDRDLGLRMEATLAAAGRVVPSWGMRVAERMRAWDDVEFSGSTPGERAMLACQAGEAAAVGTGVAKATDRARRALADGLLLAEQSVASPIFLVACVALTHSDHYAEARSSLDAAFKDARARGSAVGFAFASAWRAEAAYRAGDLMAAGADALSALEVSKERGRLIADPLALACLIHVMLERGRADDAAAALESYDGPELPPLMHGVVLDAWARVQMERRRFRAAAEAFVRVGEMQVACAVPGPQFIAWRTGAASAFAALDDTDRARDLADEALALVRQADAPRAIGSALRARALIAHEPERGDLLREAVAVLENSEARLEHAHALCELGTALRQQRSPKAAREPLRMALDLAVRCGATALVTHATAELLASGARPRRVTVSGRDALTPARPAPAS
jgi:tetratricopeptide (TPR) repeat protein